VVARARVGPAGWSAGVDELLERIAGRFGRIELRRRVRGFLLGLLADLPRKNCWTIAEHAGDGAGVPMATVSAPANTVDHQLLAETLDALKDLPFSRSLARCEATPPCRRDSALRLQVALTGIRSRRVPPPAT
jgi:hypothetical protein